MGRRLLAAEDWRVALVCCVGAADVFNGLPTTDCDLTTTGAVLALDGLLSTAALVPGGLGAVGWTTVGRTGLGFWDGRDAADAGVSTAAGLAFADDVSLGTGAAPGGLGAVGWTTVGRTSLGFLDGFASADGGFTIAGPAFALVAAPLPVVLPVAG